MIHAFARDVVTQMLQERVAKELEPFSASLVGRLLLNIQAIYRVVDERDLVSRVQIIVPFPGSTHGVEGAKTRSPGTVLSRTFLESGEIYVGVERDGSYVIGKARFADGAVRTADAFIGGGVSDLVKVGDLELEVPFVEDGVSPYALTFFSDLDRALDEYYEMRARRSHCDILATVWVDQGRLLLKNKPESTMRRSLQSFLAAYLRNATPWVLPEQNVNESEPVDIRIQWNRTRLSLIEIKWLGDSLDKTDDHISTGYRDARAIEGQLQVDAYGREQSAWAGGVIVRSRLVVFDARRSGVEVEGNIVKARDPWYYELKAVDATDLEFSETSDGEMRRWFLEPSAPR